MRQIKPTKDIKPVSEFRANAAKFLDQVRETRQPLVITQHGRGVAVLVDLDSYEDLVEEVEIRRAIERADEDRRAGRLIDNDVVMKELRARFGA